MMSDRQPQVFAMLDDFAREWKTRFPRIPPPPVGALGGVRSAGQRGAAGDERLTPQLVAQLQNTHRCTQEKILQLEEQLASKRYLQQFLERVLRCLNAAPAATTTTTTTLPGKDSSARQVQTLVQSLEQFTSPERSSLDSKSGGGISRPRALPASSHSLTYGKEARVTSQGGEDSGGATTFTQTTWPRLHKPDIVTDTRHAASTHSPPHTHSTHAHQWSSSTGVRNKVEVSCSGAGLVKQTSLISSYGVDQVCASHPEYVTRAVSVGTQSSLDMFRGKKGKLTPRRSDVGHLDSRDNSAIFGQRESMTQSYPRLEGSVKGTFQYLKLTDGFNIVLTDTLHPPASPPRHAATDVNEHIDKNTNISATDNDEDSDDPYDNNSSTLTCGQQNILKMRPSAHTVHADDRCGQVDAGDDGAVCLPASRLPPSRHATPDSNHNSAVGVYSTTISVTSSSPTPKARTKPPLPAKQKNPSAFLYDLSVTSAECREDAGRGRGDGRAALSAKAGETDTCVHIGRALVTAGHCVHTPAHDPGSERADSQTTRNVDTSGSHPHRDLVTSASPLRPESQRDDDRTGAPSAAGTTDVHSSPERDATSNGVHALCLASVNRVLEVNHILGDKKQMPEGEGAEVMSNFTLLAGPGEGEQTERYRRLSDDNGRVTPTAPPAPPPFIETDIDADDDDSVAFREKRAVAAAATTAPTRDKARHKSNTYENWTIDRAVTQQMADLTSEEDEDTDDNASPYSTLGRGVGGGTFDLQSPVPLPSPLASTNDAADDFLEHRLSDQSFIKKLNSLQQEDEDYAPLSPLPGDRSHDDRASLASDIVFFHGPERPESPQGKRSSSRERHPSGDDLGMPFNLNSTNTSSSCEEEHDFIDTSFDDLDADSLSSVSVSQRDNKLKMRHLLVCGVLDTERAYLAILELLLHYKRTLEASCKTSQPVISEDDINSIFGNLPQVFHIHQKFVEGLHAKVNDWSLEQTVGDVFKELVVMFPDFGEYVKGYKNAVATIHKCSQENTHFQELARQIVLTSTTREVTSLEDALFKPVQRLQRNTLVLHDLIKHTPEDHPDYKLLQKALQLTQYNLDNFDASVVSDGQGEERRRLVKSSFLVELVSGSRKLRFIFLFTELLVCTKRQQHRSGKVTFECKWYVPIRNLKLDTKFAYQDDMKSSRKDDIDELKRKIRGLKSELKREMKKEGIKDKHWSITSLSNSRNIEKLNKKISELEAQLILASPRLPFKVTSDSDKWHTLLMTTDYEREEWRETITSLLRKSTYQNQPMLSAYDVQEIVNSVRELPQVNKIGTVLLQTDEDAIFGTLNVTIHKLNGLQEPCDTYCCLEMDSFGHFFMKARTNICRNSVDPSWNEDFELDLEGSQTLRVLCYKKGPETEGDILLGRGALEMSKSWLKGTFQERNVVMNEYSLVISVRYTAAEKTMKRTPSKQTAAVFGVKIGVCARREGKTVPTIVTICVQEVEKRGLSETGIYRVSGVTSDVQKVKKLFDKSPKNGVANMADVDIHTVTGVLKLYLRELPEPLFTEACYQNFIDALKLSDGEAKERCMLSLLHNLPDSNYYTIVFLLEHLVKVAKHVQDNKMTVHNLSTIFGPTLLAPAAKESEVSPMEMMSKGAEEVMKQSAVIHYFLNLLMMGGSLRRSSAAVS